MARHKKAYAGEKLTAKVTFKLMPSERAALETGAAESGANLSQHTREVCLRGFGGAARVAGTRRNPASREIVNELSAIGNNVNQLTKHCNTAETAPQLQELRETMGILKAALSQGAGAVIPRNKVGRGITGAVRYALGEGNDPANGNKPRKEPKGEQSRVAWMSGQNFGFAIESREDADLARRVMEFMALNQTSSTKQCEKDCVHLSLGWRPGEEPTRAQMEEAAHQALKSLGMANARALFVAHSDERYAHMHIVASKINPDTGRAYDLKGDRLNLSKWAEAYERDFSGGIVCSRREEANQLRDGDRPARRRRRAGIDGAAAGDLHRRAARARLREADQERIERAQFAEKFSAIPTPCACPTRREGKRPATPRKAVLEAEGQVLRAAAGLARNATHAVDDGMRRAVLSRREFDGISREQAAAYRHATGAEGLALIDGQAGTGKSFTIARHSRRLRGRALQGYRPRPDQRRRGGHARRRV